MRPRISVVMKNDSSKRLFIIDGHSIVYKAFFAIRGLSTRNGIPTNGIYGFVQTLFKAIKDYSPPYLCVAFDSKVPTFRHEIYEEYKSNRPVMPDELQAQMPYIFRILEGLGIKFLLKDRYEADDIIATLTTEAGKKGWEVRIISSDKDLFQLVDDSCHTINFSKKQTLEYGPEEVEKKMGVRPENITDLLGLMGDSSDQIPGIAGVGPVTAKKLIQQFGNLENIAENTEKIKNARIRQKVEDGLEIARLSKKLATVKDDLSLDVALEDLVYEKKYSDDLLDLLGELEFKALITTIRNKTGEKSNPLKDVEHKTLTTADEIRQFVKEALKAPVLALDTETTSTDPVSCRLVGISMCYKQGYAVYIPVGHDQTMAGSGQISSEELRTLLSPLLESEDVLICGHNIKYDIKVLKRHKYEIKNPGFDTMIASSLLDPIRKSHSLKVLATEELGIPMRPITGLIGKGRNSITMAEVPVKEASDYACLDADVTFRLYHQFRKQLEKEDLKELFETLEVPLIPVLSKMELIGIAIDKEYFEQLLEETVSLLKKIEKTCFELAGTEFNLNSPKQTAAILFEDLKLKPVKKGKSGYSTDVKVLQALAAEHPLPEKLLNYRSYEKLLTTYIDALPKQVNFETGRIHTSYFQTATATGRLSSRNPNLQNIPVRTPQGRAIRRGFIPGKKGWKFLAADYSQIELRILAHLSGDKALVEAFHSGKDIHNLTAVKIFGGPEEFITGQMRDAAKTINFGVIYGMSAFRLSRELGISRSEASSFIEEYFHSYRGVKKWIDATIENAEKKGFVTTLLGRKRYVPDLKSSNRNIRSAAERIAVNTPIQGTSADMIKKAMIQVDSRIEKENLQAALLMQVHDELIFEVPENEIEKLKSLVNEEMLSAMPLDVPLLVDMKTGNSWAEC